MLHYNSTSDVETALGRALTTSENLWFRYTARIPDSLLYYIYPVLAFLVLTLVPLPLAFIELQYPSLIAKYKIQKNVQLSASEFLKCYKAIIKILIFVIFPLQLVSYPNIKLIGIRMNLPLPSIWEVLAQLLVYFSVEDYASYWIHRWLHGKWGYEKIHKVHHEYSAPIAFATTYIHWAEAILLGGPSIMGPALVPGHITTFWLWMVLRILQALETHSGYDFPLSPTKLIPFYGGAKHHDYHHYVGGRSQSNFASVFTYCDFIYGTDKGYRYHRAQQLTGKLRSRKLNGEVNNFRVNEKSE